MAAEFEMTAGSEIELVVEWGRIIASADDVPVYDLHELLKGITPENRHEETDWGPAVGREIIDDDYSRGIALL